MSDRDVLLRENGRLRKALQKFVDISLGTMDEDNLYRVQLECREVLRVQNPTTTLSFHHSFSSNDCGGQPCTGKCDQSCSHGLPIREYCYYCDPSNWTDGDPV